MRWLNILSLFSNTKIIILLVIVFIAIAIAATLIILEIKLKKKTRKKESQLVKKIKRIKRSKKSNLEKIKSLDNLSKKFLQDRFKTKQKQEYTQIAEELKDKPEIANFSFMMIRIHYKEDEVKDKEIKEIAERLISIVKKYEIREKPKDMESKLTSFFKNKKEKK